jgi:hypothetical protein
VQARRELGRAFLRLPVEQLEWIDASGVVVVEGRVQVAGGRRPGQARRPQPAATATRRISPCEPAVGVGRARRREEGEQPSG